MKSKFSQILKLKQRASSLAEAELAKARGFLNQALSEYELAKSELLGLKPALKGDGRAMAVSMHLLSLARAVLSQKAEQCELAKKQLAHYEHLYKRAKLEEEKIAYLNEQEIKKAIKKAERLEANLLDEFGVLRHSQKGQKL